MVGSEDKSRVRILKQRGMRGASETKLWTTLPDPPFADPMRLECHGFFSYAVLGTKILVSYNFQMHLTFTTFLFFIFLNKKKIAKWFSISHES